MNAELSSVDYFVLNSLLDDVESAKSIVDLSADFAQDEIEKSLQRLINARFVDCVEFDQRTKTWQRFKDYKKGQWFDLTEQGRSVALQNSSK